LIVFILPPGVTTCSNFSLILTWDIKNISPLDQRKISTGGKSKRTLKKRTSKPENFKKRRKTGEHNRKGKTLLDCDYRKKG